MWVDVALAVIGAWFAAAIVVALVLGRIIHTADGRRRTEVAFGRALRRGSRAGSRERRPSGRIQR